MKRKITDDESNAYRLGVGVGSQAADDLKIEFVVAVANDWLNLLDRNIRPAMNPQRPHGMPDDLFKQYTTGYQHGLSVRCGDIVTRLNNNRHLRTL